MFWHIFIWQWSPRLVATVSNKEFANRIVSSVKEINSNQKVWVTPAEIDDSMADVIDKYKMIMEI